MSATGQALIWKFLMTFAIALFTLALFDSNSWSLVLVYAILATVGNYLIGDLMILPAAGNLIASISDGVLAALIAYLFDIATTAFRSTFGTLAALAVLIAIGEYFFHGYIQKSEKVAP